MNVYWIDSYREYDSQLVQSVLTLFESYYKPILKTLNMNFQVVDIHDLKFYSDKIIYNDVNIFNENAIAYINCINPSIRTEKIQEELYNIAIKSKSLSILNYVKNFPMIDKNKMQILEIANALGINSTPSLLISDMKEISENKKLILSKFEMPLIIKPIDMFGGIAVNQINNEQQLTPFLETIMLTNRSFIVQKKLEIISDCRLYISDNEFVACLRRVPISKDSLGNIAKGATSSLYRPPESVINQSIHLSKKINARFLCVDWFETPKEQFYLNEIETAGGFVQLPEYERIQVASNLFKWHENE